MNLRSEWKTELSSLTDIYYDKEETISSVKANFDFRRQYSAEGKTIVIDSLYTEQVLIQQHTNPINEDKTDRKMHVSVDSKLNRGSKISFEDKLWLVFSNIKNVDDAYKSTQIQLCNYTLPFQTTSTTIYNEPCIIVDSTRSSGTGEDEGKILTLTDTQAMIYIQYNDKTKYLTEEKRIFIDQLTDKPKVYKITKVNRINYMDGDKGLLQLTCDQEEYNSTTDSYEYKIADYISTSSSPETEPTPEGLCLITNTTGVVYDTILELKIGGTKKPLVAQFKDSEGNVVDKTPIWSLDFGTSGLTESNVHLTYNESYPTRCYLAVDNNVAFIGKEFSLKLKDSENPLSEFVLNLRVVSFT